MSAVEAVSHSRFEVDPRILAVIGDAGAPRARWRTKVTPPDSLPGKLGPIANASFVFGLLREGIVRTLRMHQRYGDIVRWSYGRHDIVFVWDPETVQRILRNEDGAFSSALGWESFLFERVEPGAEASGIVVALDFDPHRAARRIMAPAFTPRAVNGYLEIARPLMAQAAQRWVAHGRVDFKREARALLADVANAIFTGIDSAQERQRVDDRLRASWGAAMTLVDQEWLSADLRRGRRAWRELNVSFAALLKEREARPGTDMLSRLAQARESGTDTAFVRNFLGLMLAAYDTTSAAVTSMAYLLARNPSWQERLRAEIDPTFDWAWKETLRMMPVAGMVPRRALRDVELHGHVIPAGCMVGPTVSFGRDPRFWDEPDRFDPERFARGEDKQRAGLHLPFGAGPHVCLGMALAGVEAKLLFTELLSRCRFRLHKDYVGRHAFTPLGSVTGDVALRLEPL